MERRVNTSASGMRLSRVAVEIPIPTGSEARRRLNKTGKAELLKESGQSIARFRIFVS